ncbi:MAG: MFS transporter [Candidatus Helarchaeota archaeon]|nr:MFS transporter [Candidatus Helarchaeota archaeon]
MNDHRYNFRVNVTVILVIIIFIINNGAQFLLYSNQNVLAEALLDAVTTETVAQIRWVIAASLLTSAATLIFWGYFSDKYSKKNILIISSAIWIAACFYIFFDSKITYEGLLVAQIFFGLGFGAVWPICYSLLGDIVKPEKRGLVFSFVGLTMGIGMTIGLFLGSLFSSASYWRFPFLIISIIGCILIIIFLVIGTDLKKGGVEHELKDVLKEGAVYTYEIKREHLRTIWRKPTNVNLFLQGIPGMIPWAMILIIAPIFFQTLNYEENTANLIVLLSQSTNIIGAIFGGWYGDRLALRSQRKRLLFVGLSILIPIPFFATAFLLPYPTVGSDAGFGTFWTTPLYPVGFLLISIGSFFAGNAGVNWYTINSDVNEPETRATIISFHTVTDRIGNALGPVLAATIGPLLAIQTGRSDAWIIAIGTLFWIPCAYFWLRSMKYIDQDVQTMKTLLKQRAKELEQGLKSK